MILSCNENNEDYIEATIINEKLIVIQAQQEGYPASTVALNQVQAKELGEELLRFAALNQKGSDHE